ncbi:MAG: tape measure protein [Saprospiraceae bacterium]|nr:tape measure protein [Saprospiraceae bacterium]
MARTIGDVTIRIGANIRQLEYQLKKAERAVMVTSERFKTMGQNLTFGVSAPILALGATSLRAAGNIQALQKGLSSVMGSAELAAIEFEKLKEVAKLPGLGLEEAARGSVQLQAAGFSADEARRSLLAFGNALATVGKGKNELNLVNLALTQLQNKTGGFGQDLRQLTEQLPQLRGALTNAFGTADSEKIQELGVTGKQVVQVLIQEFEKLPKVTGGLNNAFENFSDSLKIALFTIGDSLNKAFGVESLLDVIGKKLIGLADAFSKLNPFTQKAIFYIVGLAAAIGPLLYVFGSLYSVVQLTRIAMIGFAATSSIITF